MSELPPQDIVTEALSTEPRPQRRALPRGPKVMRMVLEGELGRDDLPDLGDMLFRLSSGGVHHVVIDFSAVTHFDYRGVKPLMRRADTFRELGGDLKLAGLSPYLFAIFRSAGAHDAFDYFASVDDAVASFNRSIFVQGR